jgi:hypothetical protein
MAMPGVFSGLNHSLEIQACGRTRMSCSSSSAWSVFRQFCSHVPSTVTLRSLIRTFSNSSSDNEVQKYLLRGMVIETGTKREPDGVTGSLWQQPARC